MEREKSVDCVNFNKYIMLLLFLILQLDSFIGDSLLPVVNIQIKGNSVFSETEIYDMLDIQFLSKATIEGGIRRVLDRYEELGYPFIRIEPANFSLFKSGISFDLEIDEGVKFFIDDVRVNGNDVTKEYVIKREFRLKKNQVFSPFLIRKAKNRIERLSFLRVKSIKPVSFNKGSGRGFLLVNIEEVSSSSFEGLMGYSSGKLGGFLKIDIDNLFGTGRNLCGSYSSYQENRTSIYVSYTEPWVLGYPIELNFEANNELFDTIMVSSLRSYLSISPFFEFAINIGVEWEKVIPGETEWFGLIGGELRTKVQTLSFSSRYSVDGVDRLGAGMEMLIRGLFFKIEGDASLKDSVPGYEMVMVGGANSVRGYEEAEVKGKAGVWINIEYRIPLGGRNRFFPFLDIGYIDMIDKNNLLIFGGGVGISFLTPIGRWSVDYGVGRNRSIMQGKLHIRLKTTL